MPLQLKYIVQPIRVTKWQILFICWLFDYSQAFFTFFSVFAGGYSRR